MPDSPPAIEHGVTRTGTVPPTVRQTGRRRRPTGSPAPLPRSLGLTGRTWLAGTILLLAWVVACALFRPARRVTDQVDAAILRSIARIRTGWLTSFLTEVDQWFSGWSVFVVGIGLLLGLVIFKRWRHLFTFLGAVFLVEFIGGEILYDGFSALARTTSPSSAAGPDSPSRRLLWRW